MNFTAQNTTTEDKLEATSCNIFFFVWGYWPCGESTLILANVSLWTLLFWSVIKVCHFQAGKKFWSLHLADMLLMICESLVLWVMIIWSLATHDKHCSYPQIIIHGYSSLDIWANFLWFRAFMIGFHLLPTPLDLSNVLGSEHVLG